MPDGNGSRGALAVMARPVRLHLRLVPFLFGVALSMAAAPACEPMLHVNGTVRDRSGHALDGVAVLLRAEGRGPHPAMTDREGVFHVSIVGAERARVSFSKDGYRPADVDVTSKEPPLSIVLDPANPTPP